MPFSAATCLTITTPTSIEFFDVYLGQNNYSPSNLITSSVPVSNFTINCPYIIDDIPDGTTHLSFRDSSGTYCVSIPIQDNNICENCDLGFSGYSTTNISKITCGILTGSCQNEITDYLIHWYGPNDTTTLSFTSGQGDFPWQIQHPFLDTTNSIFVESGVYTPIIQNVILNGIRYSNTGGTGNILFSGNCLPTTTGLPLTCSERTNLDNSWPLSGYTNKLSFDYEIQGEPLPFSSTYKISANTKYIAFSFQSYNVEDRFTLTFSGVNYTNKIGLEDIIVGGDLTNSNFSASTYPKSADTMERFTKIICLTGLSVNDNDNIIINIKPSKSDTDWTLYITCLDDYNCNDCLLTKNFKIIESSITSTTNDCNQTKIDFEISGCTNPDVNSDYLKFYVDNIFGGDGNTNITTPNGKIKLSTSLLFFNGLKCEAPAISYNNNTVCKTGNTVTIYDKTFLTDGRGVFGFTGSSTFISTYYNSMRNAFLGLSPYDSNWSGSTNSNDISYYRWYGLIIPSFLSSDDCGDSRKNLRLQLHHTSPILTGTTIDGNYYLKITANTITNQLTFTDCDVNCINNLNLRIAQTNIWSTGSTSSCSTESSPCYGTNKTFTNGIYYENPIDTVAYTTSASTSNSSILFRSKFNTPAWSYNTYPFSGDPSTILPSYSGTVCNYMSTGRYIPRFNSFYNQQFKAYYKVELTNPSNSNDFDILASPITNFDYSGMTGTPLFELAYRYSGGTPTYINPTYII